MTQLRSATQKTVPICIFLLFPVWEDERLPVSLLLALASACRPSLCLTRRIVQVSIAVMWPACGFKTNKKRQEVEFPWLQNKSRSQCLGWHSAGLQQSLNKSTSYEVSVWRLCRPITALVTRRLSGVDKYDWSFPLRLRRNTAADHLLVEGDEAVWLVGQAEGELLVLSVLDDGQAAAAVADPDDGGEDERAGQHGGATEEEGGRVTSCDVNQPTCRRRRRNEITYF